MRQLVCQACGAAMPARSAVTARDACCPACGRKAPTVRPTDVTGSELGKHLGARSGAVLLKVGASWSGPCRAMDPHFAAAAKQLAPRVKLLRLDVQADPPAAAELGVLGIPALILFRRGRAIARRTGAMSAEMIVAWTKQVLASVAPAET